MQFAHWTSPAETGLYPQVSGEIIIIPVGFWQFRWCPDWRRATLFGWAERTPDGWICTVTHYRDPWTGEVKPALVPADWLVPAKILGEMPEMEPIPDEIARQYGMLYELRQTA